MISNADRREVARRLRELDYADLQESLICAYLDALGIEGYEDWVGIAHRLADLIEPSIDRDALIKLVNEMEQEPGPVCGVCMGWSASRIRKALGVEDDN